MNAELEQDIAQLHSVLLDIHTELNTISPENFDQKMPKIMFMQTELLKQKEAMKAEYPKEEITEQSEGLAQITKQIAEKYDNVIGWYKNRIQEVERDMSVMMNKKKIANYSR